MKKLTGFIKFIIALPIVFIVFIINMILSIAVKGLHKVETDIGAEENKDRSVAVIIPSFNGKELLEECLPPLMEALAYACGTHEIIIVNNGSDDDTESFLNSYYPLVRVVSTPERLGFGKACNLGVRESSGRYVIFLNNDMIVDREFVLHLVEGINRKENIFSVTSQIFFWDASKPRQETGKTSGSFIKGLILVKHSAEIDINEFCPVLYAGGGSSIYDKDKLKALGGFDEIFHPFYVEDNDLSYRAWKRGWVSMLEPKSIVYHKHRGTIGKYYTDDYINTIVQKNNLIYFWRNISDLKYLVLHYVHLFARLYKSIGLSQALLNGFYLALPAIPRIIITKVKEERCRKINDQTILSISSSMDVCEKYYFNLK